MFAHSSKIFVKDEEVAKIHKVVVKMEDNCNLGVDEDDNEKHLEMVLRGMNNDMLLEMEQESIDKKETREKETSGEEKEPSKKFTVKGLVKAFADLKKLFKKLENTDHTTERFSLIERNVHGTLPTY